MLLKGLEEKKWEKKALESRDIYLGMTAQAVRASWGEPHQVEWAGDPDQGYQRWTYHFYFPSPGGYVKESRLLYLEKSKIVGWETPLGIQ